jgi:hypothetical protein
MRIDDLSHGFRVSDSSSEAGLRLYTPQVSVERIVAAALAEQLAGWARVEQMAARGSRKRFLAALAKVPAAEPAPEDWM